MMTRGVGRGCRAGGGGGEKPGRSLPLPAGGEVDALGSAIARQSAAGGGNLSANSTVRYAATPPPQPSPASAGEGAQQRKSLHPQHRLAVDLAGAGFRQLVDEFYLARIFVRQQFCLDKILQHFCRVVCIERAA